MKEFKVFVSTDAYSLNDQIYAYAIDGVLVEAHRSAPAISNSNGQMKVAVTVRLETDDGYNSDYFATFLAFDESELEDEVYAYAHENNLVAEEWSEPSICDTDGYFRVAVTVRFQKEI